MAKLSTFLLCALAMALAMPHATIPPAFNSDYVWKLQLSLPSGALPADSIVYVDYKTGTGKSYRSIVVAKEGGLAMFYAPSGMERATFTYDDPSTPSADGYWEGELGSPRPDLAVPIGLVPVGEVAGVLLSPDGAALDGVPVEMVCSDGVKQSALTGNSGSFSFSRVRAGPCMISASSNGLSARQQFDLSAGGFKSIDLQLQRGWDFYLCGIGLLAAGVVAAVFFFSRKKPENNEGKKPAARRKGLAAPSLKMPTGRQKDLLATLDEKEKSIVEYVMHHYPSSIKVPKLRRDLLIPKTSLTRTLQALERKQFLSMEKVGSRMYVKLHDFFRKAA